MRSISIDWFWRPRFRIWAAVATVAVCTALELYIHLYLGKATGYSHFFYIFLILMAILYHTRAVWFGVYLSGLHLGIEYVVTGGIVDINAYQRVIGFILVPLLAGYIFEQIERDHGDLLEYLTERAINREGGAAVDQEAASESCRPTPGGSAVRSLKDAANVRGLIAALSSRDDEVRYRSAIALGDLRDPAAVDALAGALKDENSGVRWEAAEALGRIGAPAVDVLIAALGDEDDDIRWRAAIALGDIRDPKVVPPLIRALADADAYVRKRAVNSLSRIGEPAIGLLLPVLREGDPVAREGALAAIAGMDARSGLALESALENADDEQKSAVRAAITIKRMRDQQSGSDRNEQ
jgi:hypothetical protein